MNYHATLLVVLFVINLCKIHAQEKHTLPTFMSGIAYADPADEITFIEAPTPDASGQAKLDYPIKIPVGRRGMEPNLSIAYESNSGQSWIGTDWNLPQSSISIDTRWGVPKYNRREESETYVYEGNQLFPSAHRTVEPRSAEKEFAPRIWVDFEKIIRHGNSPTNYWWEVRRKDGVVLFYGGLPGSGMLPDAVLRSGGGNIAKWELTRMQDTDGNHVTYYYEVVFEKQFIGRDIYLKRIEYSGFQNQAGKYEVQFISDRDLGEMIRPDISINNRFGFSQVCGQLLRKIEVRFEQEIIRSYELNYEPGAYSKTLLTSIVELDMNGEEFYRHSFEYYDDGSKNRYSEAVSWTVAKDNVLGEIINPVPGFTGESSMIGASSSSYITGGATVTVGPIGDPTSKRFSAGPSGGYASSNAEGLLALVDINGDGFPDKVFKQNGSLFFRPNLKGSGKNQYGERQEIEGIEDFSLTKTQSILVGAEVNAGVAFAGYEYNNSTTISDTYFCDYNGDNLVDIVYNGTVYFNHIEDGKPVFTTNSGDTPSPIILGDLPDLQPMEDTMDKATLFPLHDVVRRWESPCKGVIRINAPVRLIENASAAATSYGKADGVRVSIQHNGTVLWTTTIEAGDYRQKVPGLSGISVNQGDRIYFRVHSIFDGAYDQVFWDPCIDFTAGPEDYRDANNLEVRKYQASSDFLLASSQIMIVPQTGTVNITSNLIKPVISDNIELKVIRIRDSISTTIYSQPVMSFEALDTSWIIENLDVNAQDELYFLVESATQVDWANISWTPLLFYTSTDNPDIAVFGNDGQPLLTFCASVSFTMYNRTIKKAAPWVAPKDGILEVTSYLEAPFPSTGIVTMSFKSHNRLITKEEGAIGFQPLSILVEVMEGDTIFVELHSSSPAARFIDPMATVVHFDGSAVPIQVGLYISNPADQELFGPLYRGWGGFVYDGNGLRGILPIDEDQLMIDTSLAESEIDPDDFDFDNPEEIEGKFEKSNPVFNVVVVDGKSQCWTGVDNLTYIKDSIMSSSRNGLDDITPPDINTNGSGARAPSRIFISEMHCVAGGADAGVSSLTAGYANNSTRLIQDIQDLNGDRFPDIINQSGIYYSTALGGHEATPIHYDKPIHEAKSEAVGGSIGGGYVTSSASNSGDTRANNKKVNKSKGKQGNMSKKATKASESASNSAGISGEFNYDQDHVIRTWIDMNGDGLVDEIHENGDVSLNLGYSFAAPVSWGISSIRGGESFDYGGGLGINYANGSVVAGASLSRTDNFTNYALEDLNGDGLPDWITSVDPLRVRFNTGSGFTDEEYWSDLTTIEEGSSVGESINSAFTVCVNLLGFRICFNPNFSTGQGVSRQLQEFTDLNSDGFLDVLTSDSDGSLSVQSAEFGRTNLIKEIRRPLSGKITLDYDVAGGTYGMPFQEWVMSSITSDDGFERSRGPLQKTIIKYDDGALDRHERTFLGFRKVTTHELKSEKSDSIIRTVEMSYFQDHYYGSNLLVGEIVKDGSGKKFAETIYHYEMLDPISMEVLNPLELKRHRQVFPALISKNSKFYEGADLLQLEHVVRYAYDGYGNVRSIVDDGDGSATDQLTIQFEYFHLNQINVHDVVKSRIITSQGEVIRKMEQEVDQGGNIISVRDYLDANLYALTEMEYDDYGNMTKIAFPKNANEERASKLFVFDDQTHSYIVMTTDHFGYQIEKKYDFRFGKVLSYLDENGNEYDWTLDARGRISSVHNPISKNVGDPYMKNFEYYPNSTPGYAIVKHFDTELGADIETIHFVDGFSRTIQNKKTTSLFKGMDLQPQMSMTVSGWTIYDALGRMTELYHPIAESQSEKYRVNLKRDVSPPVRMKYDVLDRIIRTELQDGSVQTNQYSIGEDRAGTKLLRHLKIDALGNKSAVYLDARGRTRSTTKFDSEGEIWTDFSYNALDELIATTNHFGYESRYKYDAFGRKVESKMPDRGPVILQYDLAGNLISKVTPNLAEEIPDGGEIKYTYEYDRLVRIDYPRNIQNAVIFHYGEPGADFNRAGRMWLQEDATGGQEFFFDSLGNVTKNFRTIIVDQTNISTYVTAFEYDKWGRIRKLFYPDGEEVTYKYDLGGNLIRVEGLKEDQHYSYLESMGYDTFGEAVYRKLGNGVTVTQEFEDLRRRVSHVDRKTATGTSFGASDYQYDDHDNLTLWMRETDPSLTFAGNEKYEYEYDELHRMTTASGMIDAEEKEGFELALTYDQLYNVRSRTEKRLSDRNSVDTTQDDIYEYSVERPHQFIYKNSKEYQFDPNGNLKRKTSEIAFDHREMIWDEENRLQAITENGMVSKFTYDASDRRVIKSSGGNRGIFLDGAPVGIVQHVDDFVIYVNPFLTVEKDRFMKHYYIGSERFLTKIGTGKFVHDLLPPHRSLYAGNLDYQQKQYLIQNTLNNYYKDLQIPPGPPTLYGYYGHPDITGAPFPPSDTVSAYTAPPLDWPLPLGPADPSGPPGPPVWVAEAKDLGVPGYGFRGDDVFTEVDLFYYHTDHLGSTAFITDLGGEVRQFNAYLPFGKTFVEQKSTPESQSYLFNGKEVDERTGLVYYGARYLDSESLIWQNIDPLAEYYPSMSPYAYVGQNPVNFIDPDGRKIAIHYRYRNQDRVFKFGSRKVPNNKFVKDVLKSFVYLGGSNSALQLIDKAHHLPQTINIRYTSRLGEESFLPSKRRIKYNPRSGLVNNGQEFTPALGLLHELDHAVEYIVNEDNFFKNAMAKVQGYDDKEERRVIRGVERRAAQELNEGVRFNHGGDVIETVGPTTTRRRKIKNGQNTSGNRNFTLGRKGQL